MSLRRGAFGVKRWAVSGGAPAPLSPTHFVSATGDDTLAQATFDAAASADSPCSSRVAMAYAVAGNVVQFAAGTYSLAGPGGYTTPRLNPANSGSAGNPITFQASGLVLFTWSSSYGPLLGSNGHNYITFDGFTLNETNATLGQMRNAMVLEGCTNCTIKNGHIYSEANETAECNHAGIFMEGCGDECGNVIQNNLIHGFIDANQNAAGIEVYTSRGFTIEHNEIYGCTPYGMWIKQPSTDATETGTFIIRYNKVYTCDAGIAVGRFFGTASGWGDVYQNIVYDCNRGFKYHLGTLEAPHYVRVVNNVFADTDAANGLAGCHVGDGAYSADANLIFYNNIVTHVTGPAGNYPACFHYSKDAGAGNLTTLSDLTRFDAQHNVYHGYTTFAQLNWGGGLPQTFAEWQAFGQDSATGNGKAGQDADPLFTNEAGHVYTLQALSPAKSAGVDILNLLGGGTSAVCDAGCYVTGTETIGRTS